MKKILFIIAFLFTVFANAQGGPKVDVVKFRGEVTTTVRNTFDVPTGERWLIWNVTTEQFEHAGSDDVWTALDTDTNTTSASGISILDTANNYTGTDVETALIEIADSISSKPNLSDVGDKWSDLVDSDIFLDSDNTYDLGHPSNNFKDVFANRMFADSLFASNQFRLDPVSEPFYQTNGSMYYDSDTDQLFARIDNSWIDLGAATGNNWSDPVNSTLLPQADGVYDIGTFSFHFDEGFFYDVIAETYVDSGEDGLYTGVGFNTDGRRWNISKDQVNGELRFGYQTADQTLPYVGVYSYLYTLNESGTPSAGTDLIDKDYFDANSGGGDPDQTLSLGGTGNKDLTISGTGGNTVTLPTLANSNQTVASGNRDIQMGITAQLNFLNNAGTNVMNIQGAATRPTFPNNISVSAPVQSDDAIRLQDAETMQQYYVIQNAASDIINNTDYNAAKLYKSLFYRNIDTLLAGDGVTFATHGNKPVMVQPTNKDSTYIKKADGVDFFVAGQKAAISGDGLIVKNRNTAVGYKEGADAWYWSGDLTVHTEIIPPIYDGQNAADPFTEVNGIANITDIDASHTITSSTEQASNGTYSIKVEKTVSAADTIEIPLQNMENGSNYTITVDIYRVTTGGNIFLYANTTEGWSANNSDSNAFDQNGFWDTLTVTGTTTSTTVSILIQQSSTAAPKVYYVDNIVVTKN